MAGEFDPYAAELAEAAARQARAEAFKATVPLHKEALRAYMTTHGLSEEQIDNEDLTTAASWGAGAQLLEGQALRDWQLRALSVLADPDTSDEMRVLYDYYDIPEATPEEEALIQQHIAANRLLEQQHHELKITAKAIAKKLGFFLSEREKKCSAFSSLMSGVFTSKNLLIWSAELLSRISVPPWIPWEALRETCSA